MTVCLGRCSDLGPKKRKSCLFANRPDVEKGRSRKKPKWETKPHELDGSFDPETQQFIFLQGGRKSEKRNHINWTASTGGLPGTLLRVAPAYRTKCLYIHCRPTGTTVPIGTCGSVCGVKLKNCWAKNFGRRKNLFVDISNLKTDEGNLFVDISNLKTVERNLFVVQKKSFFF